VSHWNHRVVVRTFVHSDKFIEKTYGIHEVYYDKDDKPEGVTMEAIGIIGDSVDDIKETLDRMAKACTLPVLDYDTDFDNKDEDNV